MKATTTLYRQIYRYVWGNDSMFGAAKRRTLLGRECVIICAGKKRSALIEFLDNGQREVVSVMALKKIERREVPRANRYIG